MIQPNATHSEKLIVYLKNNQKYMWISDAYIDFQLNHCFFYTDYNYFAWVDFNVDWFYPKCAYGPYC